MMAKKELFKKRVMEIVTELKIPLINQKVYSKVTFNTGRAICNVIFRFEEDESVIRGFLGLAEYYHTVVIQRGDEYYIPHNSTLFKIESA